MAKNLGKKVPHVFETEGFNFDSGVFVPGRPVLAEELNLSQQLLNEQIQKVATGITPSGWVSSFAPYAEAGIPNQFYTQNPTKPLPELALVNGWPVRLTNTFSENANTNLVDMSEFPLLAGSRVDGVFLEVWRGLVSDEMAGKTTPSDLAQIGSLTSVSAVSPSVAWAVGENGILLKTDNSGLTWISQPSPVLTSLTAVKFVNATTGFAAGLNGALVKTEDGGLSWSRIALPSKENIAAIANVGTSLMVLVGAKGTILRSEDLFNFSLVLNTESSGRDLTSVHFYDSNVGWACGRTGVYLKTQDGGKTWRSFGVRIPDPANPETDITLVQQFNAVRFVNLSDGWIVGDNGLILRTSDGGTRWADVSRTIFNENTLEYEGVSSHLNSLEVLNSFPVQINLSLYNTFLFRAARYSLGTQYLDVTYQLVSDLSERTVRLILSHYPTDSDLVAAINAITEGGNRVFNASLTYTETSYQSHANEGSLFGASSLNIKFSMGDQAWIVGNDGVVLSTQNGGARWKREDSGTFFNLKGVSFFGNNYGWVVGEQGEIAHYNMGAWVSQDTDLSRKVQRKVFFEGNLNSPSSKNLANNSIHPDYGLATADRTQIQYRIRVVEGVDVLNAREAGLGSAYVYSRGPNSSVTSAGSYPFEHMGPLTGDQGLWRAACLNTVDGYSYAIPMFLVARRNQLPYNGQTNINGSSSEATNQIQPEGLVSSDITLDDIIDIRRKVSAPDYVELLERSFDALLSGDLSTVMANSVEAGGQTGRFILRSEPTLVDQAALASGTWNSEARIEDIPEITVPPSLIPVPSGSVYTLPLLTSALYHHDSQEFSIAYEGGDYPDPQVDPVPVPGTFEGLGTSQARFVFGDDVDNGEDIAYLIRGKLINYAPVSTLSGTPSVPVQVRLTQGGSPSSALNYLGVSSGVESQVVRFLESGSSTQRDYVVKSAIGFSNGVKTCSSLVRLVMHQEVESSTKELRVPKNIEGYFTVAIKSVENVADGGVYRIQEVLGRDQSDTSVMKIILVPTYTITAGSLVRITLEVLDNDVVATAPTDAMLGKFVANQGASLDALRNSYVAVFDTAVKGITSLTRGVIREIAPVDSKYRLPGSFLGVATMPTLQGLETPYAWTLQGGLLGTTVLLRLVEDISGPYLEPLDSGIPLVSLYVPMLLEGAGQFGNDSYDTNFVVYKQKAPQTVRPLPSSLEVEVLVSSPKMYIIPLGEGGGFRSPYYNNPGEHLPVYDSLTNESYFFNVKGLDFPSFFEDLGCVPLPTRMGRTPSKKVTLSSAGSDAKGRTSYKTSSETLIFKAENLLLGNPRKIAVPMLVKVTSSSNSSFLQGEIALAVLTTHKNTELSNEVSVGPEQGEAVVALYKVPGMPLVR